MKDALTSPLKDALTFLQQWAPSGPWSLGAIDPDDSSSGGHDWLTTRDIAAVERFLTENAERGRNLYFQPNLCRSDLSTMRARRGNVAVALCVHAEIDPPEYVKTPEALKAWQLGKGEELYSDEYWPRLNLPRPTVILFSGTGYVVMWRLEESVVLWRGEPVAQDPFLVDAVESRNRALVEKLGADPASTDVSRLLRLPGTLNHASESKRAKGRTEPVLAEIIEYESSRTTSLALMPAAAPQIASQHVVIPDFEGAPPPEAIEAAAQVLGKAWAPDGTKHQAHLALAGSLARIGWPAELIASFAARVAEIDKPGNANLDKRRKAAETSVTKLHTGQIVTGWPSLIEHVDEAVVGEVRQILGLPAPIEHDPEFTAVLVDARGSSPDDLPTRDLVRSALEGAIQKLQRKTKASDKHEAKMLRKVLSGKELVRDDEDPKRALVDAATAVIRHAPPGTSDAQFAEVLLGSVSLMGFKTDIDELITGSRRRVEKSRVVEIAHRSPDEFILADSGPRAGMPVPTEQQNIRVALKKLGVTCRYNLFADQELISQDGLEEEVQDHHIKILRNEFQRRYQILFEKDFLFDTCEVIARENSFHPVLEYLDTLPTEIPDEYLDFAETWLIRFAGAEDTPYVREVSRLFLVAAVRRVRDPGCLFQEMVILESAQGKGKCLQRGTRVMMFDGSLRAVEDVRDGDLLMGPDSMPRRVMGTTKGVGPLRRITPTKGDSWVCNDQHVLTVALHGQEGYHDAPVGDFIPHKWGSRHEPSNKYAMLVRASGVRFDHHDVVVEPYLVGLWLGDGTTASSAITNIEPEVLAYCEAIAPKYGVGCKVTHNSNGVSHIALTGHVGQYHRSNPQPLMAVFKTCVVDGEKRIPRNYLINDATSRLELLAGLIDTDGYYGTGVYNITTKWRGLRDDILYLARSLGLAAYSTEVTKTIKSLGFSGQYHSITISGDIERVPVKVPRKKAAPRRQVKDVLRTGFRVEDIGIGEYFGFELDGDSRFLLGDFTITHNSEGLRALVPNGEWFLDDFALHTDDSKRMLEQTDGKWIIEAAELKGFLSTSDDSVKQYLSRREDRARMSYGRKTRLKKRQFVMIGTINDYEYLKDLTGNRRYWPVRITEFQVEALREARDTIWAVASYLEQQHPEPEYIRLDPSFYAVATEEQEKRRTVSPTENTLRELLEGVTGALQVSDLYKVLFDDKRPNKTQNQEVVAVLQALGFIPDRTARVDGKQKRWYMRGDSDSQRYVRINVIGSSITGFEVKLSQVVPTTVSKTPQSPTAPAN